MSSGGAPRITEVMLERYLAGELSPEQRRRVESACAQSAPLAAQLARLAEERKQFLAGHPAEAFAHQVHTRLAVQAPRAPRRWLLWVLTPTAAGALAAAMVGVVFHRQGAPLAPAVPSDSEWRPEAASQAPARPEPAKAEAAPPEPTVPEPTAPQPAPVASPSPPEEEARIARRRAPAGSSAAREVGQGLSGLSGKGSGLGGGGSAGGGNGGGALGLFGRGADLGASDRAGVARAPAADKESSSPAPAKPTRWAPPPPREELKAKSSAAVELEADDRAVLAQGEKSAKKRDLAESAGEPLTRADELAAPAPASAGAAAPRSTSDTDWLERAPAAASAPVRVWLERRAGEPLAVVGGIAQARGGEEVTLRGAVSSDGSVLVLSVRAGEKARVLFRGVARAPELRARFVVPTTSSAHVESLYVIISDEPVSSSALEALSVWATPPPQLALPGTQRRLVMRVVP